MVPNIFPPKEFLKKLKKPPYDKILRRIPLFLSVALVLVMGVSFLVTKSAPQTAGIGIALKPGGEDVTGLRAYQTDFRGPGTWIGNTDPQQNISRATSADTTEGSFGACPAGDAQLPFNLFYPGRGQPNPDLLGARLIGKEVDPYTGQSPWSFDNGPFENGDIPAWYTDHLNVPSIQKISRDMLDKVFPPAGSNEGLNGVVFGNDVNFAGSQGAIIIVAAFKYNPDGTSVVQKVKRFFINRDTGYFTNSQWIWNRVLIDFDIWEYRCSKSSYHEIDVSGSRAKYKFADEPDRVPPNGQLANHQAYPGGLGLLHDVHMIPRGNSFSFITTIVDWGVFEFVPTGGENLGCTMKYSLPSYCYVSEMYDSTDDKNPDNSWVHPDAHTTPGPTCSVGINKRYWSFRQVGSGFDKQHQLPTTWYAQPLDDGNLLVAVNPWKSYTGNVMPSFPAPNTYPDNNHPLAANKGNLRYKLSQITISGTPYNTVVYPESNNGAAPDWYVAPSEVRIIRRSDGAQVGTYTPGYSSKPKLWGNIGEVNKVGGDIFINNTNYFSVGSGPGTPLEAGDVQCLGQNCDSNPLGPRIEKLYGAYTSYRNNGWNNYSETAFPLPNGYFFVNGMMSDHAHYGDFTGGGFPTIVDSNGNRQWVLWDNFYVHMGAGAYVAYGTPRNLNNLTNQNINNIIDKRDGGLASQLTEAPPNNSWVRDFDRIKLDGNNHRDPSNPVPGTNTKIAYALADENKTIFKTYDFDSKDDTNPGIIQTLIAQGKDLKDCHNIWLQALMWGDAGNNLNRFQTSDTPILYYWGVNYTDKSAKLDASKVGIGGIYNTTDHTNGNDPTDSQYKNSDSSWKDGSNQFYTKKDQNMVRYKVGTTNFGEWPANNIKLVDKIPAPNSNTTAKTTFYTNGGSNPAPSDYINNKAYYRVIPKGGGVGTQGTLTVKGRATKDEWDETTPLGCLSRTDCNNQGGALGGYCGDIDLGCQWGCSGTDLRWGASCGSDTDLGCQYSCNGAAHQHWGESCYSSGGWCAWTGSCPICCEYDWDRNHNYCNGYFGCAPNQCRCYHYNGQHCWQEHGTHCLQSKYNCSRTVHKGPVWPHMKVSVGGAQVWEGDVNSANWQKDIPYTMTENDCVVIEFTNDSCHGAPPNQDCNLYIDSVTLNSVNQPDAESVTSSPCNYLTPQDSSPKKGATMQCNGTLTYKCTSSLPYYPIPDANISVTGATPDPDIETHPNIGGIINITLPSSFIIPGGTSDRINNGDKVDIIYTTTLLKAGNIQNKAAFMFNNVGNSQSIPDPFPTNGNDQSGVVTCIGNAPYIATQFGDVYLGGGVHPYYAYGNATFLIQSKGSLANFNSSKKGWVQNNYPIEKGELSFTNVKSTMQNNVSAIKNNQSYYDYHALPAGSTLSDATLGSSSSSSKQTVYYCPGDLTIKPSLLGTMNVNGPTTIIVDGGNLYIKRAITSGTVLQYGTTSVNDISKLPSLGVIVRGGNIYIDPDVSKIVGAYYCANIGPTGGIIYTGDDAGAPTQISCDGLWIAHGFILQRVWVGSNADPAEKIIYDGRVALNPPPGFSQIGDLMPIWREVAP